nr:hypothetical protein [Pseudomonas lini]
MLLELPRDPPFDEKAVRLYHVIGQIEGGLLVAAADAQATIKAGTSQIARDQRAQHGITEVEAGIQLVGGTLLAALETLKQQVFTVVAGALAFTSVAVSWLHFVGQSL